MTKIPTVREMEELLLRDSTTEDLVEWHDTNAKSPNTKLTAEQVRHEVSVFARVLEYLFVHSLLRSDNGCKHHKALTLGQLQNFVNNLVYALLLDFLAALGAVGNAHSGPQQTQIVVNFCGAANCRTGVSGIYFLLNRNCRWNTYNTLHRRFGHPSQKLSCEG